MSNNVVNLSFRDKKLTEIHVDNDPERVILLDVGDVGVVTRFNEAVSKMDAVDAKFRAVRDAREGADDDSMDNIQRYAEVIAEAEKDMAEIIDGIFGAKVCETAAGGASLFTPCDGAFLYENIITVLSGLYGDELQKQAELRKQRISKHTAKYHK